RHLNERDPPQVGCGDKSCQVANHTSTQGQDERLALQTSHCELIATSLKRPYALGLFASRHFYQRTIKSCACQRLRGCRGKTRRHVRVRNDRASITKL